MQRSFMLFAMLGLLVPFVGCASSSLPTPRARIGALPFPGITSLYAAADPEHVAPHFYRGRMSRPFEAEGDRGIVYTKRAGFLDIAHVRESMDWTWYIGQRIRNDIKLMESSGSDVCTSIQYEDSTIAIHVPSTASNELVDALAAHTAYRLLTWHEITTWFGKSAVPLVSERRSTFTVDDTASHVVGVVVGVQMLSSASTLDHYDRQAGQRLADMLTQLEAMSGSETSAMCRSVEGTWWQGTTPLMIDINVGLDEPRKHPILVHQHTGFEVGSALPALPALPEWIDNWFELQPCTQVTGNVREVLAKSVITSDDDLELLIQRVAQEIAQHRNGVVIINDEWVRSRTADYATVAKH